VNNAPTPPGLFVIAEFGQSGGTRTFFFRLVSMLTELQIRPCVLLNPAQEDPEVRRWLDERGIECQAAWTWPPVLAKLQARFPFGALYDLVLWRRHLRNRPADAVLISTGSPGRWLGLFRQARKAIYILHTIPDRSLDPISRWLTLRRSGAAHRFLTVSQYSRRQMLARWLGVGRTASVPAVAVVHNCADLPDSEEAPRQLNGPKRVLTLGHVTAHKNPDYWIEIAATVRATLRDEPVEFVWAGEGDRLEQCRTEIARRGLKGVSFVGLQRDLASLFRDCWVYFQPSLVENHSIAIVTAMQLAIPCVVSSVGGSPESVVDRETGFVVPLDPSALCVEALTRLLSDESLNERLGQAGRRRYYSHFSQKRWHEQMERELRDWLSCGKPR
jgi:glycosyltransferase involved in cell wall biosynthesis